MASGEFAARQLEKKRKKWKRKHRKYKKKRFGRKYNLLEGSPQGRGIVIEKRGVTQKQPHSGIMKCVRVQLIKNGKQLTAFAPRDGAIKFIDEHDEVIVEGVGGAQGGPYGSQWGVKYRVTHVNNQALEMLRTGKKEKIKR
ncbi:MAG: 30S ribosomal protein S12 [Candidatus Diapherotrites archaeon]|uniref:30S ribosomal protein S12 n=1 Tax=Candidatus Iainarchaeum sp. TaxID=3101447 RepID=A0A7J4KRT2_9ARCH|nr:MAG: 30S ribosomal protein S12, small subunit ribosomal protein S12 [archaeon GW2011_AR21]MBS3058761.1 30S ribosomal protein S12 [Candidatus Diapherotrites archaeon]HIH21659.1 30S ribosomal protein S12 [Candidatus Diapherotrites archaeon]HIH32713.1 30S ribosomal protein S12 [Candidatus Diapherotrites archaeon]